MSDNIETPSPASISDLTIHILREIQVDIKDMKGHLVRHDTELSELRREMRERFDNLIGIFGGSYRDHELRLSRVEVRVDRLENPPPTRRRT